MDDREREIFSIENGSGSKKRQSNTEEENSQSNSDENNEKIQFILSIDKGYTSAAKSLLFEVVRNHNKMAVDNVHSSPTGNPEIFEKVFSMLTSESFLRAIENGDMKAATEFLESSWTFHASLCEASCFAERAIKYAAKIGNAKAFNLITSALFLKAVKTGDTYSVKKFLNGSRNERSMRSEALCIKSIDREFIINVDAFDMDSLLGCCISFSDWLEGISISPRRILHELSKFEKIVDGVTKNGWTALHMVLFQLKNQFGKRERTILRRLLEFMNLNLNALRDEMEALLQFILRCSVNVEPFTMFIRKLLKHRVDVTQRNSFGENALMIASTTIDIDAIMEIIKWKDHYDFIANISARDEIGQTALSFNKQSNNAEIILAMIEQNLFLRAVENDDTETVQAYLTAKESDFEVLYRRAETNIQLPACIDRNSQKMGIQFREDNLIEKSPRKSLEEEIDAPRLNLKVSITPSVWLKAVTIAQHNCHVEMLNLLYIDDRFIHGFNKDGQTILHQLVAQYFATAHNYRELETIKTLLKSGKFGANILNFQNETIFELVCKISTKNSIELVKLLRIFFQNGFDLYDRNKNGETLLMVAWKNKRDDIVQSLLDWASREFVIDIGAVDNSFQTALMKAKEQDFSKIVVALLRLKLISSVKDENVDMIKSVLLDFRNTSDSCLKSWNSITFRDVMNEKEHKYGIWRDAMFIAMKNDTKHSEEILKLLLDCDILVSQEGFQFIHRGNEMRFNELLLESGKINVNARDEMGNTALHWSEEEKVTSLLIRCGADVNKKDGKGRTPIIAKCRGTSTQELSVLRTMLEEAGTLLDATDCNGRTALMTAVMESQPYGVQLLLNAGASVNVSDHLGFTALHYALHRGIYEDAEFPRNSEELKKIKEMAVLFDAGKSNEKCNMFHKNKEWSEEKMKIVKILLLRSDIDVNALSFEMFTPLDIAEGWIQEIPPSIKNALKEKGAVLNVFRQTQSQSTSEFYLDIRCRLMMHRLVAFGISTDRPKEDLDFLKGRFLALIETFKEQIITGKDQKGRTALHLVAISFYTLRHGMDRSAYNEYTIDLSNTIVHELVTLGCSVNEIDIFGRTPLHYANKTTKDLLISYGADASIKDKDGNIASGEAPMRDDSMNASKILEALGSRNKERYFLRLMSDKQMQISVHNVNTQSDVSNSASELWLEEVNLKSVPRLLWEKSKYAFRHPLVKQITKDVRDLMHAIAKEIGRLDPRFEIRVEFVGGSNEGTKSDVPDEFDFCFVLTKISRLCEVSQSPELPNGFVRLKRKAREEGEDSDFNGHFKDDGMLNTEKLNSQFTTILLSALVNTENQQNFEFILELLPFLDKSHKIEKVINIGMHKPMIFTPVDYISIDIVPCIHIDDWWPDEAISNVSDEIKKSGCNLVFDRPQNLYHWVPYSESCARISFSKAESETIKQSCDKAKEAYMIGKTMIDKSGSNSKYILKNSLLYCIEALTPTSEKASQLGLSLEELEFKYHQMDRYLWLKCLMKCHLEFVSQALCPYYFFPSCSSLIGVNLTKYFHYCLTDAHATFPDLCEKAYAFYRSTCNDTSESCYKLPAPDPLWEHFDRNQLIASLCEIAYK